MAILRLALLGHASTVLLILAAMALTLRYRCIASISRRL
jgi:hypothetical protein